MFSTALSLLRTPQKALPRPSDANTTRGGKRNAPSSPDGSDGTIDIEENENKIAEKVAVLEGRVSSLSDRVEYQQDRILQLEQTVEQQKIISKSTNIIIYGIEEHLRDGEVRQLLGGGRDLPSLIPNIVDTYRLGQLKANAARPRPVLVKFNSTRSRNAAFKHSKRLRGRSLSLAEDLTPRPDPQISILLKPKAIQCCGEEEPFAFAKQMGESVGPRSSPSWPTSCPGFPRAPGSTNPSNHQSTSRAGPTHEGLFQRNPASTPGSPAQRMDDHCQWQTGTAHSA
jgi:hypothetical protein